MKQKKIALGVSARHMSAFTLIEVMIVLAIIVIIAAMCLPNFQRAAKMANKTICVNNLKLLKNAVQLYLFDYPGLDESGDISPSVLCSDAKYIKEPETEIRCPEKGGQTSYLDFPMDGDPVCPYGPITTDPPGDGSFPEHVVP